MRLRHSTSNYDEWNWNARYLPANAIATIVQRF
jgi:hypothetical protein